MSEEYTPTTDEVRGDYAHFQTPGGTDPVTGEFAEGLAEFDRWLAAEKAKAWEEGAQAQWSYGPKPIPNEYKKNPYRRGGSDE